MSYSKQITYAGRCSDRYGFGNYGRTARLVANMTDEYDYLRRDDNKHLWEADDKAREEERQKRIEAIENEA